MSNFKTLVEWGVIGLLLALSAWAVAEIGRASCRERV